MKRQLTIAIALCFVLAVMIVTPACTKQGAVKEGADPTGAHTLISVNGNSVPASVSNQGFSLKVLSGTFTIKADGTCSSKTVFVNPSGTEVAREVTATYTQDGSELTMKWEGAGTTVGTIQGNTFTMDNEGMVFVYEK